MRNQGAFFWSIVISAVVTAVGCSGSSSGVDAAGAGDGGNGGDDGGSSSATDGGDKSSDGGTATTNDAGKIGSLDAGAISGQQAYLKASNTQANTQFGTSMAFSADGNTLAVGIIGDASNANTINGNDKDTSETYAGAVDIFSRTGSTWTRTAYIKASNNAANFEFGQSVALSPDGKTLVVGAPGDTNTSTGVDGSQSSGFVESVGAAYIFQNGASGWAQTHYLKPSNPLAEAEFGTAVAISGDGSTIVVAANEESSNATGVNGTGTNTGNEGAGAVYVFAKSSGGVWSGPTYIKPSNTRAFALFGSSIGLSTDGSVLAVGSSGESSAASGVDNPNQSDTSMPDSGAVYLFARSAAGVWSQSHYLKAKYPQENYDFGSSVALSGDGKTLAVGSYGESSDATGLNGDETDTSASQSGAVFLFTNGGSWTQSTYIKSDPTSVYGNLAFGVSVALSTDGDSLLVGASGDSSNATGLDGNETDSSAHDSGAAFLFTNGASGWAKKHYIKASNPDAGDSFGLVTAISGDGSTIAANAPNEASKATGVNGDETDNSDVSAGAVYVFH